MEQQDSYLTTIRQYLQALVQFAGVPRLLAILGIMLGGAVLEGIGLLVLLPILNALDSQGAAVVTLPVLGQRSLPLSGWLAAFVLFIACRALVLRLRDTRTATLRAGFVEHLRVQFYAAIAAAEWRFLAASPHAELFRLMTTVMDSISNGTYYLLQMAVNILMAGASLAVAIYIAPMLTLPAIVAGGVLWLVQRRRLQRAHSIGVDFTERDRLLFASASEFFGGLKLIKSAGAERLQRERFETESHEFCAVQDAFFRSQATSRAIHMLASGVLIALLLLFSVDVLHLPRADLVLSLLILARLLPVTNQLHTDLQQILHMLPSFVQRQEWLKRCLSAAETASAAGDSRVAFEQAIQLHDVVFRHQPDGAAALDGINLQITACSTTALVGVSGAGKTTLADVLLGLLAPDSGSVLVDGQMLAANQRLAWRQSAGYVPQEAFLFPGSVRANLLWAHPSANEAPVGDDAIWQALQQAAAADFVARLPQGLDTLVGERGIRLSGGERQRLVLARALLRQPRLLVLDEATSHLDNESEREIQRALATLHGQLTLVVIAHRLSTIRHADNIVVMERGKIIECGNWASLSASSGRFREILDAIPHEPYCP